MKAIVANLGFILQTSGVIILLTVIPACIYREQAALTSILATATVLFASGFAMNALSQRKELDFKESCILISIVFFTLGIVGSIPYLGTDVFAGSSVISKIINSFFESVSGYTTTGFSLINDPDSLPRSIVFYRSLTQWIGGIGIVFIILVFFNSAEALEKLSKAIGFKKLTSRMTNSYIRTLGIYAAYTLVFFCLLYAAGVRDWLTDISLVFSGISTGGFSPVNNLSDLMTFPANFILSLLMIVGATSFTVHYRIFSRKFKKAVNLEFVVLVSLTIFFTFIFWILTQTNIVTAFFHIASTSSTTGYSYIDIGNLAVNTKMLLFVLMFIGGSSFSTAGGIKIIGFIIFIKAIPWLIKSVITGKTEHLTLRRKELKILDVYTYIISILIAVTLILVFSFIFTSCGFSFVDSVFELTSALSNSGLSAGIVSPSLNGFLKFILILVMVIGRVGIIAFLVALSPKLAEETTAEPIKTLFDSEA